MSKLLEFVRFFCLNIDKLQSIQFYAQRYKLCNLILPSNSFVSGMIYAEENKCLVSLMRNHRNDATAAGRVVNVLTMHIIIKITVYKMLVLLD